MWRTFFAELFFMEDGQRLSCTISTHLHNENKNTYWLMNKKLMIEEQTTVTLAWSPLENSEEDDVEGKSIYSICILSFQNWMKIILLYQVEINKDHNTNQNFRTTHEKATAFDVKKLIFL